LGELQSVFVQNLQVERGETVTTLEAAVQIIRDSCQVLDPERIELTECLHRVLREDVLSDIEMPPFDKSAVDGYACRKKDIRNLLTVVETIPAGVQPQKTIGNNQCAKIMTGAVMPGGADCVLLREEVEELSGGTVRFKRETTAVNICFKGEDVVVGQKLLVAGTRITPSQVAAMALAGNAHPLVSRRPNIAIIATGDEIVEPSVHPGLSQIRNSNSYQLIAHCQQFGGNPKYYGIVGDTNETIERVIEQAKEENDVLLLTGGVSAGDLDLVPALLETTGFQILFKGVGIQPGRPTIFGKAGRKCVFGIPGSPVASFIVFEVLIKELLAAMLGLQKFIATARCSLECTVKRQKTNRIGWRPVSVTPDGKAHAVDYHGTAHISSYALADGIIAIPIGVAELNEGSMVDVRLI
jgi:molybdopterin molybdotransferase